jgi:hypothetical protein
MQDKGQTENASHRHRTLRSLSGALLISATLLVSFSPAEPEASPPHQRPSMIKDLLATNATPALADELQLFGQFVGDWDIRTENYLPDRTVKNRGGLHVGWILYGTALQDIWTTEKADVPPGYPPKSFGTTIRFFDAKAKSWQVVWIAPVEGVVKTFAVHVQAGEIILERHAPAGGIEQWIWSHYSADAFEWRSTESLDEGKTWKVTQRIWGKRSAGDGKP